VLAQVGLIDHPLATKTEQARKVIDNAAEPSNELLARAKLEKTTSDL
jgi:hypothetical protein